MTGPEIIALVNRLTYKPGHKLLAQLDPCEHIIRIVLFVADAPSPDERSQPQLLRWETRVHGDQLEAMNQKAVLHKITGLIMSYEMHEIDEWLRKDGVPVNDPHPHKA